MNKKWLLKLSGSLLAVLLITGCATDDQDPAPPGTEQDGTEDQGDLGTDEMTPEGDVTTPADETTPGTTEEGEGTPGEADEGITEDPEQNMGEGQGTNGGTENGGTGTGTENGEDEENK
jgi:hypothetical protein